MGTAGRKNAVIFLANNNASNMQKCFFPKTSRKKGLSLESRTVGRVVRKVSVKRRKFYLQPFCDL